MQNEQLSKCCQATMTVFTGSEGTNHWICARCGQPCDPVERDARALQAQKNGAEIMKIAHKYGITVLDALDIFDAFKRLPKIYEYEKDELATARAEGAVEMRDVMIVSGVEIDGVDYIPLEGALNRSSDLLEALTTKEHHVSK